MKGMMVEKIGTSKTKAKRIRKGYSDDWINQRLTAI